MNKKNKTAPPVTRAQLNVLLKRTAQNTADIAACACIINALSRHVWWTTQPDLDAIIARLAV